MERSTPVDGFSLAYDRPSPGAGPPVLLLHGWPGDRHDWRGVVDALSGHGVDLIVPDLRGFGESDKRAVDPSAEYDAGAQVRSVAGLLEELALGPVIAAGYDVGSRVAQRLARTVAGAVRSLVISPPVPGAGDRVLDPEQQAEFWYQSFHRLELAAALLDGRPDAVRSYLEHFWSHWSGPDFTPDDAELDRLAERYGAPGAFLASIGWYRAGSGMVATSLQEHVPAPEKRLAVPTIVLWPEHDPLFPRAWGDRLDQWFSDVSAEWLDGAGHFTPVEAPDRVAQAILARL